MGKVILEFDSIEEQDGIKMALDGHKWYLAMWDFDQLLRTLTKHDVSILNPKVESSEVEYKIAEKLREEIRGILDDHGIKFE